jgi:hypothetical protein
MEKENARVCRSRPVSLSNALLYIIASKYPRRKCLAVSSEYSVSCINTDQTYFVEMKNLLKDLQRNFKVIPSVPIN